MNYAKEISASVAVAINNSAVNDRRLIVLRDFRLFQTLEASHNNVVIGYKVVSLLYLIKNMFYLNEVDFTFFSIIRSRMVLLVTDLRNDRSNFFEMKSRHLGCDLYFPCHLTKKP